MNLSIDPDNRFAIVSAGAMAQVAVVVHEGDTLMKESAAAALTNVTLRANPTALLNIDVAVKFLEIQSNQDRENLLLEITVWHEASHHPSIVPMLGACHVGSPGFMVSTYVSGGTLPNYLRRNGRSRVWRELLDVTHGLQFLHRKGIVHGLLNGNDILMDGNTARITDFGASFFSSMVPPHFATLGAVRWRAPENIFDGVASFETDVYSLGMCIVEAVTGEFPWGATLPDDLIKNHLRHGRFMNRPSEMSEEAWAMVCAMCTFEPSERMALEEVERRVRTFAEDEEGLPIFA